MMIIHIRKWLLNECNHDDYTHTKMVINRHNHDYIAHTIRISKHAILYKINIKLNH